VGGRKSLGRGSLEHQPRVADDAGLIGVAEAIAGARYRRVR
jgi:hypothetical protein